MEDPGPIPDRVFFQRLFARVILRLTQERPPLPASPDLRGILVCKLRENGFDAEVDRNSKDGIRIGPWVCDVIRDYTGPAPRWQCLIIDRKGGL